MESRLPQGNVEECIISSRASREQTNKKGPETGPFTDSDIKIDHALRV